MTTHHDNGKHQHPEGTYDPECSECQTDDTAVDWLMAVRKFGIEEANRMFPEG